MSAKSEPRLPETETVAEARHAPGLPRNQSLQRAVELLRALAVRPAGATAAELARTTNLPSPTTGRLLATLADLGLAERLSGNGAWVLGYDIVRLGRAADPYRAFIQRAQPHLEELVRATGESVALAVVRLPHDLEVIVQADSPQLIGITNWVGRRFGLHASAAGKLALAQLPEDELRELVTQATLERYTARTLTDPDDLVAEVAKARRRGYGETVDELEEGLSGIAVMIGAATDPGFAIGVSGPSPRLPAARRKAILPALRVCAESVAPLLP